MAEASIELVAVGNPSVRRRQSSPTAFRPGSMQALGRTTPMLLFGIWHVGKHLSAVGEAMACRCLLADKNDARDPIDLAVPELDFLPRIAQRTELDP